MKYLFLCFSFIFTFDLLASDSIVDKKKSTMKWEFELIYAKTFNNQYSKNVKSSGIPPNEIVNYLDTSAISCYTNSIGLSFARKVHKHFKIQSGLIYGRKGTISAREISAFYTGNGYGLYIKTIPEKILTIPFRLNPNYSYFNDKLTIGILAGFDVNFNTDRKNKDINNNPYFKPDYLKQNNKGFFGFKASKEFPGDTKLLHDQAAVGLLHYIVGFNIQIKLLKNVYSELNYNYSSSFSKFEFNQYFYDRINLPRGSWISYNSIPYMHNLGLGLGVRF
jgi:hypothetical protein